MTVAWGGWAGRMTVESNGKEKKKENGNGRIDHGCGVRICHFPGNEIFSKKQQIKLSEVICRQVSQSVLDIGFMKMDK